MCTGVVQSHVGTSAVLIYIHNIKQNFVVTNLGNIFLRHC